MILAHKQYNDIPFAHRQHNHGGHCHFIHGHNWSFKFTFACNIRDENGFVIDFGDLKWLKAWINERFDHKLVLNEGDPMRDFITNVLTGVGAEGPLFPKNPVMADIIYVPDASVEGLCLWVYDHINRKVKELTHGRVWLHEITIMEDARNGATYRP